MDDTLLAVMDRFIEPVRAELRSVDNKLDRVLALGERIAVTESSTQAIMDRVARVEAESETSKGQLQTIKGRNQVILWILGLVGAPTVVGLALLGAQHAVR